MFSEKDISEVLAQWEIVPVRLCPEILIAGSPDRTEYRVVVESAEGKLYVVEQVLPRLKEHKATLARTLELLASAGFREVAPYQRNVGGEFLAEAQGGVWQVVPYISGVDLSRPQYVHERWRGKAMATVLLDLRKSSACVPDVLKNMGFSLPGYIEKLISVISRRRPDLTPRVERMRAFCKDRIYSVYDSLPVAFCHGDYHAINIIWSKGGISSLIDWEFLGFRPELYDAANMIGCLGIEDPECLWGDLIRDFVSTLRDGGLGTDISFKVLPDLVIALRFAWLSEWLRREDDDMILMELDYFDVLSAQRNDLARLWSLL